MSKYSYVVLLIGLLIFAIAGHFALFSLPVHASAEIELRSVQEFFATQIYISSGLGALVGAMMVFLALRLRHIPSDRGTDYLGRVVWYGAIGALLAIVVVFGVETLVASIWSLEPLSPSEKVALLVPSGLFVVLLAHAGAAALLTYGFVSRSITWGGQYAFAAAPKL